MAEYIEREAFLTAQRHLYCENCAKRKGMKNGKVRFVYDIGDAPCRACDIGDMLDSIEDYCPAADVVPVVRCKDCDSYSKRDGWCRSFEIYQDENGFCSYGERKDGDGDGV